MNKHFSKIQELAKPKFAPFGFADEDIKGVLEGISSNFNEDEELDEQKANALIDAVVPTLKAAQSMANRTINAKIEEYKKQNPPQDTKKDPKGGNGGNGGGDNQNGIPTEKPEWLKEILAANEQAVKSLQDKVDAMESEKLLATRKGQYEKVVEGLKETMPKQYDMLMKNFDRISFKDDDEFNQFITDETESVKSLVQEFTDKGLITTPPSGGNGNGDRDVLAEQINAGTKAIEDANKKQ